MDTEYQKQQENTSYPAEHELGAQKEKPSRQPVCRQLSPPPFLRPARLPSPGWEHAVLGRAAEPCPCSNKVHT